ncbi:MAG: hypothetical protein N3G76_02175 [Candidatus Micrarchaeota archaeon]|nr:hypothetical protein [Candidatus Micrarchaeota archaeon]
MKKGQAAMEYLMTYGWALLVIVLVLGALIYLNVLNPQSRLQDTCNLPIGFKCEVAGLTQDGYLKLRITNQQAISLANLAVACKEGSGIGATAKFSSGQTLSPGESKEFTCPEQLFSGTKQIGEISSGEVMVKYSDGADKYVKGSYTAKVSQLQK